MPVRPSLGKGQIRRINTAIDSLFDKLSARVLGEGFGPKELRFRVKKPLSLPGLFQAAGWSEANKVDNAILEPVLQIAKGYLDGQRERAKAKVVNAVQSYLNEAFDRGESPEPEDYLGPQLSDVFGETKRQVQRIVSSEANTAKNTGLLDGIIQVNALNNIDDPVIGWLCVHDNDLCDECKRLHLLDNEKTPRLWYLSEVGHGYHKPGEDVPKVGGLHPNDRCTLITMLPGYGFDERGRVKWIGIGHNEIDHQRAPGGEQPGVATEG